MNPPHPASHPASHPTLRLAGRVVQLYVGLILFGLSMAMLIQAGLGAMPWDVFHQGVSRQTGWPLGAVVIATGVAVLLLWLPLRERPGFGTVSNVLVIGLSVDAAVRLIPHPQLLAGQIALVAGGILVNAFSTLLYIKPRFGSGPRDGLLTGLLRLTGLPTAVLKVGIEVTVVAVGWTLGGTVGLATVAFALGVGPTMQAMGRFFPGLALTATRPEPAPAPLIGRTRVAPGRPAGRR